MIKISLLKRALPFYDFPFFPLEEKETLFSFFPHGASPVQILSFSFFRDFFSLTRAWPFSSPCVLFFFPALIFNVALLPALFPARYLPPPLARNSAKPFLFAPPR